MIKTPSSRLSVAFKAAYLIRTVRLCIVDEIVLDFDFHRATPPFRNTSRQTELSRELLKSILRESFTPECRVTKYTKIPNNCAEEFYGIRCETTVLLALHIK